MLGCGENRFEDLISLENECYYFHIFVQNYPSMKDAILYTSWNLKTILDDHDIPVENFVNSFSSVESFEHGLKDLIKSRRGSDNYEAINERKYYTALLRELKVISHTPVLSGSDELKFTINDVSSREHRLLIQLPPKYPDEPGIINYHDMPILDGVNKPNFKEAKSITQIHNAFCQMIELFQPFWDMMEVLDSSCWVLEPQETKLSDHFRRIRLCEVCSVLLTFNPYQPMERPNIDMRGPQTKVDRLLKLLEKNLMNDVWDPEVDVHLNLMSVLELDTLPIKPLDFIDDYKLVQPGECGICFVDRLNDEPAILRCDNSRCDSQFHQGCLMIYLGTNLNNIRMKSAVFGRCPACRDPIGCPVTSVTGMFS